MTLPLFLPLAVSVVAGESIAGEASTGTLRSLLVVPVEPQPAAGDQVRRHRRLRASRRPQPSSRLRGSLVGFVLFPTGPVTLLSGSVIPLGNALLRVALVAVYVAAMLAGVAAIGLFVSTLTEVPLAAMATTAIVVVTVEILDAVPQIAAIHPWLFTHWWLSFGDLLRDPVALDQMAQRAPRRRRLRRRVRRARLGTAHHPRRHVVERARWAMSRG